MTLPEAIRKDPYYPLAPGSTWVYRDKAREAHIRTTIRSIDPAGDAEWRVRIETLFTLSGATVEEQLSVRPDGVYALHGGRWNGPDPRLPLALGAEWTFGADTAYPIVSRVRGPVPVLLEFGRLAECLRLDQAGTDGNAVRTEWYAAGIGLVRWIDHWEDHSDTYDLVYALNARTGEEFGTWPPTVPAC